ncbi:hypothetical protein BDY17DRAFT_297272 [Neohortaea acidophila]|uniref:Uncharacterized protein n=1 Tax=Neohortaea acidophila TaxID=245834 RepID=A0A6A6PTL7_9PEZI|nr:uncharacterized protein BDY17DRAFT_297272 [Neohortaea acidophila]KAF2483332.1 hypothetical protein BDY17DRAFT_297272 [Neohortaea acidophila]
MKTTRRYGRAIHEHASGRARPPALAPHRGHCSIPCHAEAQESLRVIALQDLHFQPRPISPP